MPRSLPRRLRISPWRLEALHTTLWLVPTVEIVAAGALFAVTYAIDRRAYHGDLTLPGWVNNGSADAARQILTAIAAAVITVVGLVFSITIVALTLASTQFGPRMLRNFVRDLGTQIDLTRHSPRKRNRSNTIKGSARLSGRSCAACQPSA